MTPPIARRAFLQGTTALSLSRVMGANERVGVGFIGFGLIGKRHVLDFQARPNVDLVGLSEAHSGRMAEGRSLMGPSCRAFPDFRRMLDDKDVDAVVVSTPDHWHALMTMMACAAGKDVYVEKPLTLFVREGRWIADVARRHKRVVQVGTQQRSGAHYQRAREMVRAGRIGRVVSAKMGAHRNIMPGFLFPRVEGPPPELDWDGFLGPAPFRPYSTHRGPYHFRWHWETSGGQMTNLGHHSLDVVRWTMEEDPVAVSSVGGRHSLQDEGETPDVQDALFQFAGQGGWTASWSCREASAGPRSGPGGVEFFGTKGTLSINRQGMTITGDVKAPPENFVPVFAGQPVGGPRRTETVGPPERWCLPLVDQSGSEDEQFAGHVADFLECVKTRRAPVSEVESGHRVSTMCHLSNLSMKLGRSLRWDARAEDVVGDQEASAALSRPYRAPWDKELAALIGPGDGRGDR